MELARAAAEAVQAKGGEGVVYRRRWIAFGTAKCSSSTLRLRPQRLRSVLPRPRESRAGQLRQHYAAGVWYQ